MVGVRVVPRFILTFVGGLRRQFYRTVSYLCIWTRRPKGTIWALAGRYVLMALIRILKAPGYEILRMHGSSFGL